MQENKALNANQQSFAADNHELVYQFLTRKGLSVDDFYDVVIFRYLHAVKTYMEHPELSKFSFKAIAFQNMHSALSNYYVAQGCKKRNAVVLSLDAPIHEDGVLSYADTLQGECRVHEYAELREAWEAAHPAITEGQMNVLQLRSVGYTHKEIGEIYHLSAGGISSRISRLRKKVKERLAA